MEIFLIVIEKIFGTKNFTNNTLIGLLFNIFKNTSDINIIKKYSFIKKTLDNCFLNNYDKEDFLNILNKIQRISFALSRFSHIYKFKKSKIIVNEDMSLTPIKIYDKGIICLYQNKYRYLFNINDLINIINNALTNSNFFFSKPLVIKNPFNNIPFNKSSLYNIYFFIRFQTLVIPDLIHKYFLTNFNLCDFTRKFEYLIRENIIDNYIPNNTEIVLCNLIIEMIYLYNICNNRKNIKISSDFPIEQIVIIFKPYLKLYLKYKYSLIFDNKDDEKKILFSKLREFYNYNPNFSRKILLLENTIGNKNKYTHSFDYKHITYKREPVRDILIVEP